MTDGLPAHIEAAEKVFDSGRTRANRHLFEIHLTNHSANNNMVERLNCTVRGRQKPAGGLKAPSGPLTQGQAVYFNMIRPHQALDGKTPADAAGLETPTEGHRWAALIQSARRSKRVS